MTDRQALIRSASSKRSILVVEDEMINRELLGFLIGDEYHVLFAETGAAALEIIKEQYHMLSLVLLDLNLPDMKGQVILRSIKEDGETANLPVIVMTADSDAEVECLVLGAIDFIPKPYPKREVILARILRTIELFEERDIIRSTERDALTGLYNREYFYRYSAQFDTFHPDTETDAVLIDVNHFHILNERYGRAYCDEILRKIAAALLEIFGETGIVCRREADTFLVYCLHRDDYEEVLRNTGNIEENQIHLRAGVYSNVDREIEVEHRFDRAKLAADTVKNSFTRWIAIYDNSLHEKEVFAERLMESFHAAIREKQFTVHYQPKFDVRPQEPVLNSAEALVRWKHPEFGMVSPGVFIPIFEENGLIRELDSFVWREVASQIRQWKKTLGRSIPVSINVSRIDLYDPKLPETLNEIVSTYGLSHDELLLEITESAYTENSDQIISIVNQLRGSGFHIEMDDFGTGYSSLNMISALPIDVLKLDMQFIRTAFRERKDTRLLEAIIGLAKSMNLPTIAEGVETAEQMFTLKSMGCDVIQGYYFSKPLPAEEFETFVRNLSVGVPTGVPGAQSFVKEGPRDRYTYEALHDPLTGLYNHSAFDILFQDSDQNHIAVMIATIDDYAAIRSERGREYANRAVLRVADVLRGSFRSADHVCRLQEDEFVVIVTRMTSSMQDLVLRKVEQINSALGAPADGLDPIMMSVGIAFSDRENPQGNVFTDADSALKKMKQIRRSGCAVY